MTRKTNTNRNRIKIMHNGTIDLSSLLDDLPSEIHTKVSDECILLTKTWYLNGTQRRCKVRIRRFIDAEKFALALGLYRAEGQKKPTRLRFVNKDPILHRWFIEALKAMGISEFRAYAQYCFCRRCGLRRLEDAIKRFEKETGVRVSNVYRNEAAHNPTFYLDVNNKVLATLLITAERTLRKEIARGNIPRNVANKYLKGVLEGDGSLNLKIDEGKVKGMHLELNESDTDAIRDLLLIVDKLLGIKLAAYKTGDQKASIDLDELLDMLMEDLIPRRHLGKVKKRVILAIRRRRTPWILMRLADTFGDKWFSSTEASNVLFKTRHHALETLNTLEERGYLISKKVKDYRRAKHAGTPVRRLFKLTQKAKRLTKLLPSLTHSLPSFYSIILTLP